MNLVLTAGSACLTTLLVSISANAATAAAGGNHYTNFGMDIIAPIFPVGGSLAIYQKKSDKAPKEELRGKSSWRLEGKVGKCTGTTSDGWAFCNIEGAEGWGRRATFKSGAEITAPSKWPFRYWLYVASTGMGGMSPT